ncbi:MAG: type II secretion system ATPase GspE [Candidatus Calescibacterium sp.]|nr:type II secretion system ATPase GspE [Candidatus Calescibacterium sp.]MDW8086669.1 type II secretion system ATPase GspE [Candidatus Calescibacterium sp.]
MKLIGEILQDLGVPKEKVDEALRIQEEKPNYGRLGEILIKMGVINHVILAKALSAQFGIELKEKINKEEVLDEVTKIFPPYILKDSGFIVLKEPNSEYVSIVLSDPEKSYLISDLQKKFKKVLKLFIAPSDEIERVINEIYGFGDTMEVSREVEKAEEIFSSDEIIETTRDILEEKGEAPIIRFVNALFFQAVKRRASDIHIEPAETETVVRMRIDGVLHEVIRVNKVLHEPIVSRVKVISRLDIAEKRLPQDGKIKLKVAGKDIDVRVSTLPTVFGERVSLRILDRTATILKIEELGMEEDIIQKIKNLVKRTYGMILITGPTGSGKTTTLYACLSEINSREINIITIEDPIEYQLKGINQIQVNPKVGLTFAAGLRSILRQDPDVVMVGEIRDGETASIAIHAALTGHLVLSTLHTNDAPSAITRLIDMEIEPYLISSAVFATLAQRLVRKICEKCKKKYKPDTMELEVLSIPSGELDFAFRGTGCDECFGTGYKGRIGIFELFVIDDEIRELINQKSDSVKLKNAAISKGMRTLREDGILKIKKGITTIQEVARVIQES